MKILVVTISDRASRGEYEDLSGPAVKEILEESITGADVEVVIVPDEENEIAGALESGLGGAAIITTGGTGLGPRDITPEVTERFCDRAAPGISEMLRAESLKETPYAALSRGYSGMKGSTLVVNIPGSVRGASFCARLLAPLLEHAEGMISGEGH
ncbi:MAG: MogA/MoaB family molybdenum cofactor biosynthesis protein [Candidatus Krumholzibacteria bacterium]|nr:MogA/MoaB family molybdenum cofactor biosynthesis protein [Candidatus Krumholzibacteria bacterium]